MRRKDNSLICILVFLVCLGMVICIIGCGENKISATDVSNNQQPSTDVQYSFDTVNGSISNLIIDNNSRRISFDVDSDTTYFPIDNFVSDSFFGVYSDAELTNRIYQIALNEGTTIVYLMFGNGNQIVTYTASIHKHTYSTTWSLDDTYHWHDATCGHDVINDKAEHNWQITYTVPATETTDGINIFACSVCGATKTESIPSSSIEHVHTYSSLWTADDVYHWHNATCGHDVIADKSAHNWQVTYTLPATDSTDGVVIYICSICRATKTENIPATTTGHIHTFSTIWTTDSNYHWHAATCGHSIENDKALHQWDDGNITLAATENSEGEKTYTCLVCGLKRIESIPKTDAVPNTATISFNLNGGQTSSNVSPKTVESLNAGDFFFDVTKDGFNFRGWSYDGIKVFDEGGTIINNVALKPNMTFVAEYSNTAKLTIIANMPEAGDYSTGGEFAYNAEVDIFAHPYQGYQFVGWIYNNAVLSNQQDYLYKMWDKDITIEARFKLSTYTLNLTSNNADKGLILINPKGISDNYTYAQNAKFDYKTSITIAAYTKTDTRFLGWYDNDNVLVTTNAVYTFNMPNNDYQLTAKWNYFTIEYNMDGGTNDDSNPAWYDVDMDNIVLKNPTHSKYNFLGWESNGEKVSIINTKAGLNISLLATWSLLKKYTGNEEDVIIDGSITAIGPDAFKDCSFIKTVSIHNEVTEIGEGAFSGCSALESITIPFVGAETGKTKEDTYQYPFGYIFGTTSYIGGTSIKQYYYEKSTSSTNYSTYYIPTSLESVMVTGGNILSGAFYNCNELSTIIIPNSATSIEALAFYNCSRLSSIIVPNSITSIGINAFNNCSELTSIIIPKGLTAIQERAFYNCSKLSSISYNGNIVNWCGIYGLENLMQYGSNTKALYINDVLIENILIIPEDINNIPSYAFCGCRSLVSVSISNNVTNIDSGAFINCTGITNITIGDGVESIGNNAFLGCNALETITYFGSIVRWCEIDGLYNLMCLGGSSKYLYRECTNRRRVNYSRNRNKHTSLRFL